MQSQACCCSSVPIEWPAKVRTRSQFSRFAGAVEPNEPRCGVIIKSKVAAVSRCEPQPKLALGHWRRDVQLGQPYAPTSSQWHRHLQWLRTWTRVSAIDGEGGLRCSWSSPIIWRPSHNVDRAMVLCHCCQQGPVRLLLRQQHSTQAPYSNSAI